MLIGEGLDAELSDVVLDKAVLESNLGDLDLGLLWDEIHLSLSFLQYGVVEKNEKNLPPPGV